MLFFRYLNSFPVSSGLNVKYTPTHFFLLTYKFQYPYIKRKEVGVFNLTTH